MSSFHGRLSIREARKIDLVDYLSGLGYKPAKIRGADYWYLSPLRVERVPSFKVNRKINRWFDYGLGQGGNLVDFAVLYSHCTVGELMRDLNAKALHRQPSFHQTEKYKHFRSSSLSILKEAPLTSVSLIRYLRERRIPLITADKYCREIVYEARDRCYTGIGFQNDSGGWEIRNRFFKGSNSPKDITTRRHEADTVAVFEGFMDFLSFKAVIEDPDQRPDYVVLNSIVFFDRARPFMESHKRVLLFFDHDPAGEACLRNALSLDAKYEDAGSLYQGYKDLNDWMVGMGHRDRAL